MSRRRQRGFDAAGRAHARSLPGAVVLCLLLAPVLPGRGQPARLETAREILALPPESARQGRPVQLNGVVRFHDATASILVVADDTGGILVRTAVPHLALARGQGVSVEGITALFGTNLFVNRAQVATRPEVRPVTAEPATVSDLLNGRVNYRYVELEGLIGSIEERQERARLHVHSGDNYFDAVLRDVAPADPALPRFQDARVRLRGVVLPFQRPAAQSRRPILAMTSLEEARIEAPGPAQRFDLPATDISRVPAFTTDCRIRLLGRVVAVETNGWLRLQDGTGQVRVRVDHPMPVRAGDEVEVVGFPLEHRGQPTLDHTLVRVVAPPFQAAAGRAPGSNPPPLLPLLQSIAEISRLPPDEARQGYPVRLRGTVTFYDPAWHMLFLRDAAHGIFVWLAHGQRAAHPGVHPGQILEVNGFTSRGDYIPTVIEGRLTPLAEGELPAPRELPYDALASGQHDSQWVALDGIVRAVKVDGSHLVLDVATTGGRFNAMVSGHTNAVPPDHLVDAAVRLRGVCSIIPNPRRQAVGFRLFVPRPGDITVQRPAPVDPFSLQERPAVSLFRYNPQEATGHRVKVRGVVTLQRRPDTFFLRDDTGGLFIELRDHCAVQAGDIVEVVGFPAVLASSARLEDAIFRKIGSTRAPAPKPITPAQALNGFHEGEWVSIQARLVEVLLQAEQPILVLEAGRSVFQAAYVRTNSAAAFRHLRPGTLLRVPGICTVKIDEQGVPRSFSLQAGSPAGIVVLQPAPWWTPRHALLLGGSLLFLVLAALAWGFLLRRQVHKQTHVILELNASLERRVAERTAELESANRELESFSYSVSHDLRAPLRAVNGFAEVLLQTHAPQLDEKGSRYLRHVADGGRRMGRLVDDLLTFSRLGRQALDRAPLDLNLIVTQVLDEVRRQDPLRQVEVRLQPLPPAEGDRALIQQVLVNLVANAWKFTARHPAPLIEIGCLTHGHGPAWFVRDNGAGFDMKYADKLFGVFQRLHRDEEFPGTGVGLAIVQRIIHRHGGRVWAESQPGAGATFYFTLAAESVKTEPCSAFGK